VTFLLLDVEYIRSTSTIKI